MQQSDFDLGQALEKHVQVQLVDDNTEHENPEPPEPNELRVVKGLENVKNQIQQEACEDVIEGPQPLQRKALPALTFPNDALPDVLREAALSLNRSIQAPVALCGQSVLAAATLAVQGHANIIIDGRTFPVSNNYLTIGCSGERKSAVDSQALRAHAEHQKLLKAEYEDKKFEFNVKFDAWKKSKEKLLNQGKTHQERKELLRNLGPQPNLPLGYILKTDETTFQGLFKLLLYGQPSIGLFSDEGGRMIGGYGLHDENKLQLVAGLSNLWDGRPLTRSTGSDGTTVLYGRRVSIHLMVQKKAAMEFLLDNTIRDQGFLSRCLTIMPESTIGERPYSSHDLSKDRFLWSFWNRNREILKDPLPIDDESKTPNELRLRNIPLSKQAKNLWVQFHDHIEKQMGDGEPLAGLVDFANKLPEHSARLAGVFALFNNIHVQEISITDMERGITLADYYLKENIRLRQTGNLDPELELAQKVLDFLNKQWLPDYGKYIDLVSLYQRGPSPIRNSKKARYVLKILSDHFWVRPAERMKINGKMRNEVWEIVHA